MKAYRRINDDIIEIEVDVDENGNPLLPIDSTVDPKPQPLANHYVTIVGNEWVQLPLQASSKTLEALKEEALKKLSVYKDWYLDQPIEHDGRLFDADDKARMRFTQALVMYTANNYLPPAWIDYNNRPYPITSINDLQSLITKVQTAFTTRFYEMSALREQILDAENENELNAIQIPVIP